MILYASEYGKDITINVI